MKILHFKGGICIYIYISMCIIFIMYFVVYLNVYETFLVLAQIGGIWEQDVDYLDLRVYNLFSVVLHPKLILVCLMCFIDHTQTHTHSW